MFNRLSSTIRPALALALAAAAWQVSPVYALPSLVDDATTKASSVESAINQAQTLLRAGHLIEARSALLTFLQSPAAAKAPQSEIDRAYQVLSSIGRRMESADPLEMSLQKAGLALREGDLATAGLHGEAVASSSKANSQQMSKAKALLGLVAERRAELAPMVPEAIEQSAVDFAAGRYAQAKAGLTAVVRSGVPLSEAERSRVDTLQLRLLDLEAIRGADFAVEPGAMGLLQPGVIQPEPRGEQPAAQPERPAERPAEQPAAQPEVQPAPPPPPPDDMITTALKVQATALIAEADQALRDLNLNEARAKYRRVQTEFASFLTPEQTRHVDAQLSEVHLRLGIQPGAALEGELVRIELIRSEARAEFNNLIGQARRALDQGDPGSARQFVAQATLKVNSVRTYLAETTYEAYIRQARNLENEIRQAETRIAEQESRRQASDIARQADEQRTRMARQREERIRELLDRARAYQQDLRYDEALQTVDQLLFLDPNNAAGLLLRDLYTDILIYRSDNEARRRKGLRYAELTLENNDAMEIKPGVVNFSPNWRSITILRGDSQAFTESPENRRILASLQSRRVPAVTFNDNALEDVITFVEAVSQMNIDTNWEALARIGIQRETPVSLNLRDVAISTLLDRVLGKVSPDDRDKADWAIHEGILTISSDEDLRKTTSLHIYDIRDLLLDVPDYDEVPQIDLQSALQQSRGGGGQSPFRNDQQDDEQDRRTLEERILDIIEIIQTNVDPEGWLDTGGRPGRIQQFGGSLIITQTDKNHRQVSGLLQKLRDVRAMQINVETRFLLVNQDWFEQIGFDIDVYLNTNNNQVRAVRATDPAIQGGRDFFNFRGSQPTTLQSGPGLNRVVTGPGATVNVPNPGGWSPIAFEQDSFGLAQALTPSQGIAADILNATPALGIAGQFLDDIQVDFLVTSTQADRRSIQLTAPRLTFTNGQIANIYVATQVAFVSDLQPVVGDSAVGFDPTVDVVTEGVTLLVEGVISADRRYVTMNVDAGVARIDGFGAQAVTAVAGGQLVNSADTQTFIQLPTVTVTRVRTTVTVPDQGTVLLGGQRLVTEFEVETGVPVLSKLPILNRFFSNRIESKEEQTLLILIKPTVLIQNEQEERNFPGILDSATTGLSG